DIIERIRASLVLSGRFDPAYAPIARPLGDGYQNLSGHRRATAARRAGLTEIPCWVRNYNDQEAYMVLVTSNDQSELSALERGLHALHSRMEVKAYAASVGRAHQTVYDEVYAAEVAEAVPHMRNELVSVSYKALAKIRVAPRWLWPALVSAVVAKSWTV